MRRASPRFSIGVILLAVAVLVAPGSAAAAEPAARPAHLAILSIARGGPLATIEALREALRDLGWIEGRNIRIDVHYATRGFAQLPELAATIVRSRPDVIFTSSTPGVLAAKGATSLIPIVVGSAGDLARRGVVQTLARPGGNITGISLISREMDSKRLELVKELLPGLSSVAYLANPDNRIWDTVPSSLGDAARLLRLRLLRVEARNVPGFAAALDAAAERGAQAVVMVNDPVFNLNRARIVALARQRRMPVIAARREFVEAGGLIAYGSDLPDMWRQAATYVDKILKGANPSDLPVERPRRFSLLVNLGTARALGIDIPKSILLRADRVIE